MIISFFLFISSGYLLYLLLKPPVSFQQEKESTEVSDPKPTLHLYPQSAGKLATVKQYPNQPFLRNSVTSMANTND